MRSLLNIAGVLTARWSGRFGRSAALLASAVLMAACGGSEAPGLTTPAPVLPTLTVALTDSSGAARNTVTSASPLTATATLVGANGRPLANSLIQFSLALVGDPPAAVLSPASGSGVTDGNGRFSVTLLAASASVEGGGTITATAVNVTDATPASASFQVIATAPPPSQPAVTLTLTDPVTGASRNTVSAGTPLKATATLVDGTGRPVANSLIQFSTTFTGGGTPAAALDPTSGSGITDASGRFSVTLLATSESAEGGGTITATAVNQTDAAPGSADFQVLATAPPPQRPTVTLALTDPATGANRNTLTFATPLRASARLLDGSGRPVANSLIRFSLSFVGGTQVAVLTPSSGSGITDANGWFSVTLAASSEVVEGGGTITATAVNVTNANPGTASFQVVATSTPPKPPVLTVALTDASTGASRNTLAYGAPLTATATLVDGSGRPLANSLIQYSLNFPAGTAVAVLSPSSGNGITDANGRFSITLVTVDRAAEGSGTVTAQAINETGTPSSSASFQVVATEPPTTAPVVTLALTDPATGAARNSLTLASPLNATATLRDASGRAVANSLIQFSLTTAGGGAPVAVFSPSSGNGITDANGRFSVVLQAAGFTAQGAGTVRAAAVNEPNAPSASASYQVGATPISLGNVTRTPAEIEPLQTSTITAQVTGVPPSIPVTVRFSSPCASSGLASLPASAVTVNGVATAVYTDKGCSGTDTITISADGATAIQTSIVILQAPPVAIQFVSATPDVISISGVGGQPSSVVIFKVVNAAQQPVADLPVTLSLSTSVGGVTLDGQAVSVTKRTAQDGTARATVVAGTQPGPVRVAASAAGGLSALSSVLTIQTGLPTQARFSLSFQTFNIEGGNVDGTATSVTIRAADRVGNPVPDGTTINFRSSGAVIEPSCRTSAGACSVNFRSQASRPASGRVAVLAWAVGEENFFDANGNNQYDGGEPFGDLGSAFVDANLNNVFDSGVEEFIAYNPVGTGACAPSTLALPGVPNTCDRVWGLAHVRASGQVVLSGSTAFAPNQPGLVFLTGPADVCEGSFSFTLVDVNGNPMPAGTTITTSLASTVFGSPVANTINPTSVTVQLSLPAEPSLGDPAVNRCQGQGVKTLRVTVTTPLGNVTVLPPITVIY